MDIDAYLLFQDDNKPLNIFHEAVNEWKQQ